MDLDRMFWDELSLPLVFHYYPYFKQKFQRPSPWSLITSNEHPIIEPVRFPRNSSSFFLSCSSCLSMFPSATNRFNGTWTYSRQAMKVPCFSLV